MRTVSASYQQIELLANKILCPTCPYTLEPLTLKKHRNVYYINDYVPSSKWRFSEYANKTFLASAIYKFKREDNSQLEFELLWGVLQLCKDIEEEDIYLFNVPSSDVENTDTPISRLIHKLGTPCSSVFVDFMRDLFCEDRNFHDCSGFIERTESIVPNHQRSEKNIRHSSFLEQTNSMRCSDEFVEYADNLREEEITGACLILDDIVTNGNTINAAHGVLKEESWKFCNPDSIYKLVLARTVQ